MLLMLMLLMLMLLLSSFTLLALFPNC